MSSLAFVVIAEERLHFTRLIRGVKGNAMDLCQNAIVLHTCGDRSWIVSQTVLEARAGAEGKGGLEER